MNYSTSNYVLFTAQNNDLRWYLNAGLQCTLKVVQTIEALLTMYKSHKMYAYELKKKVSFGTDGQPNENTQCLQPCTIDIAHLLNVSLSFQ